MNETSELRSGFSLREPLYLLYKRKRQIVSVFITTVALVVVGSYVLPRQYESRSRVYVERQTPAFASSSAPRSFFMALDRKEVLNSEVDFITSRAVAERVVERLEGPAGAQKEQPPPRSIVARLVRGFRNAVRGTLIAVGLNDPPGDPREGMISSLQRKIKAEPALQSNMITISFRSADPGYAVQVVDAATEVYLLERLKLLRRPGLDAFYDEHIRRSEALVSSLEKQAAELKRRTGIVAVDEEIQLKLDELSELETRLNVAKVETNEYLERSSSLKRQIAAEPATMTASRLVQQNPAVAELESRRRELLDLRTTELNQFKVDSPPVKDLDRRIAAIDDAIAKEPPTRTSSESVAMNSILTVLRSELYAAEASYAASRSSERSIQDQMQTLRIEIRRISDQSDKLHRLAESIASAERIYYNYKEQREEARIEANTDPSTANVKVIHRATVPSQPLYSRLTLILLGVVTGLGLGLGLAFFSEFFDHSLCTREDVERHLELPFLGSLPESDAASRPL